MRDERPFSTSHLAPQPPEQDCTGTPPASAPGLRVLFITHYAELYGANLSLLNLIEGLDRYGIQSHVISPEQGDATPGTGRGNEASGPPCSRTNGGSHRGEP